MAVQEVISFIDRLGAIPAETYVDNIVLVAGVAKTVTVPSDATHAIFSGTGDFWAIFKASTAAVVPSADITDGTGCVLNPTMRDVNALTEFSLISSATPLISIAFVKKS